jgi:hypothetical protein
METNKIISEIKKCIKNAHKFSEGLGGSTLIDKETIINCLINFSPTQIHLALLEMQEKGEIKFTIDDPVIILTDDFKYETSSNG